MSSTQALTPFHPGEQAVQTVAGVREEAEVRGQKMLTPSLVAAQREFFAGLPFVVTAHVDEAGQPWAGLINGRPGFVMATPDGHVRIKHSEGTVTPAGSAVLDASFLQPGSPIGLLGIELARRRRNRINATVTEVSDGVLKAAIDQGYGNCPKYITKRPWNPDVFAGRYRTMRSATITDDVADLLGMTDTFFLASSSGPGLESESIQPQAWGVDISHRGGEPGFVEIDGNTIAFDDYPGNNLFNTLGNLQQYPHCSVLVLDFETGDIVQLAGRADLQHDGDKYRVTIDIHEVRNFQKEQNA